MKNVLKSLRRYWNRPVLDALREIPPHPSAISQILLQREYVRALRNGEPAPNFEDVGFQVHSQADEDGILLYLFAVAGARHKTCVEICAGNGLECNTANLILNHGWHGLLVDGNPELVAEGTAFYRRDRRTCVFPPCFVRSWITRDGVNALLVDNGFRGEVDLLSLDLDGVDYWIWDAIAEIEPRIVVAEYQDILGPERSCTVPYSDDFDSSRYPKVDGKPNFAGASLAAFVKLGRKKGYRLVGANRYGFNAFFVRNDVAFHEIPETSVADCFRHPKTIADQATRFPSVAGLPWVEV